MKKPTDKELYKKLQDYGKSFSCPFTADEMLNNKVSTSKLCGHVELREYVEEYRKAHLPARQKRRMPEDYF